MNLVIWDIESSNANTDFRSIIEIGGILGDENLKDVDANWYKNLPIIVKLKLPPSKEFGSEIQEIIYKKNDNGKYELNTFCNIIDTVGPEPNSLFPENVVSVSEPMVFRDITVVQVSLTPFQYNPVTKTLRIYTEIVISVIADGPGEINVITNPSNKIKLLVSNTTIGCY